MVSIIPREVRRKRRGESFSAREPTSPKVSCMGQVQGKKKRRARKQKKAQAQSHAQKDPTKIIDSVGEWKKIVHKVLEEKTVEAPSLNAMKKFSSGRGSFYDFDVTIAERWTSHFHLLFTINHNKCSMFFSLSLTFPFILISSYVTLLLVYKSSLDSLMYEGRSILVENKNQIKSLKDIYRQWASYQKL